jgi:hypothetical protein
MRLGSASGSRPSGYPRRLPVSRSLRVVAQLSIFLENKSGGLADVFDVPARRGVNLRSHLSELMGPRAIELGGAKGVRVVDRRGEGR